MYQAHLENILPEPENMTAIWNLLQLDPYLPLQETDDLYMNALRELVAFHRKHNTFYDQYLAKANFTEDQLTDINQLAKIPFIHANYFKTHEVPTVSRDKVIATVTSSGTTGQKSQHFLDEWTNNAVFYISDKSQEANGFVSEEECNYLVFNYEPFASLKTGTAKTNQKMMQYAPAHHVNYALRFDGRSAHEFDSFGMVDKLLQYQQEGLPVRMLGFAAFLNFTIEKLKDLGYNSLPLHPHSRCLFGGGWKNHQDKEMPKLEFYQKIHEFFGIPLENIRDKYGSVEHPITYVECSEHHLHIPTYERVIVLDVKTLAPLGYGVPGFAHLISPVLTAMPSHSILMGDLIILHPAESCSCGKGTPWVEIMGRAGTSKNKSCAIAASEMLKR